MGLRLAEQNTNTTRMESRHSCFQIMAWFRPSLSSLILFKNHTHTWIELLQVLHSTDQFIGTCNTSNLPHLPSLHHSPVTDDIPPMTQGTH